MAAKCTHVCVHGYSPRRFLTRRHRPIVAASSPRKRELSSLAAFFGPSLVLSPTVCAVAVVRVAVVDGADLASLLEASCVVAVARAAAFDATVFVGSGDAVPVYIVATAVISSVVLAVGTACVDFAFFLTTLVATTHHGVTQLMHGRNVMVHEEYLRTDVQAPKQRHGRT